MRCDITECNKKLVLDFPCKMCKKIFCISHRLPENHKCSNYELYKNEKVELVKIVDKMKGMRI